MEECGITGKEHSECYSDVPKLIDFFKSEMPLREDRHMGTREYLCGPGSQQRSVSPAASLERAIADSEERQLEPTLVDFFKDGNGDLHLRHHGVEAPVINRSTSSVEAKQHPMPKLELETGGHWSVQGANPLQALKMVLSPTSTGTAESGTAAPKTPTCDMEIAYSRPPPDHNESSAHQGSTIFSHGCSKLPGSGEVCADSGTSHGRLRRNSPEGEEEEDEETEAVVQAATSLLSLASHESTHRHRRRRRRPDVSPGGSPVESERESDESELSGSVDRDGACSSVLYRPTNKRRYKLMVDLLAETPTVL